MITSGLGRPSSLPQRSTEVSILQFPRVPTCTQRPHLSHVFIPQCVPFFPDGPVESLSRSTSPTSSLRKPMNPPSADRSPALFPFQITCTPPPGWMPGRPCRTLFRLHISDMLGRTRPEAGADRSSLPRYYALSTFLVRVSFPLAILTTLSSYSTSHSTRRFPRSRLSSFSLWTKEASPDDLCDPPTGCL